MIHVKSSRLLILYTLRMMEFNILSSFWQEKTPNPYYLTSVGKVGSNSNIGWIAVPYYTHIHGSHRMPLNENIFFLVPPGD